MFEKIYKFLVKLICVFVFSKNLKKILKIKTGLKPPLGMDVLYEFMVQPLYLKNYAEHCLDAERLILGSSHAMKGWVEASGELNLGMSSQDLYYSYNLYRDYAVNMTNLKQIILFYSVFSRGFDLSKCSEYARCAGYKIFFGIPYKDYDFLKKKYIDKIEKEIFDNYKTLTDMSKQYKCNDSYRETLVDLVASKHLKNNLRNDDAHKYLLQFLKDAESRRHQVILIIPPFRKDYKEHLPDCSVLFSGLEELVNKFPNAKLVNFYNDIDFENADFSDCDHLKLSTGAQKLKRKLVKIGII